MYLPKSKLCILQKFMELKTLFKLSYGMYIVCSRKDDKINGQIVNTVFQITSEPPTIAISINKNNFTHQCITQTKKFTISILDKETPLKLIGNFGFKSGRDIDKFVNIKYKFGITNLPIILENTVGYLELELISQFDIETHTIFVGKVIEAQILSNTEPMTYAYYHEVKRGTTSKNAPTYIKPEEIK